MTPDTNLESTISCGIAGWSYPDWNGYVYTPAIKDTLRYIAGYVDMIEINSSFYRPPSRRNVESWVRRTTDLPGFFFTAKLHQQITHQGIVDTQMVRQFHEGLAPMVEAGKLAHLLAQFRYDYADTAKNREHLRRIHENFADLTTLTFELRHNSWQSPTALDYLGSLGVSVAHLDYPLARNSFNLRICPVGEHAYLRLHGRNAKAWFSKAGRDETYNYLYSEKELDEIVERAVAIAAQSKSLTLVANNHYQGKEAVNILQIKSRLTDGTIDVPAKLLERYPDLNKIARKT